MRQLDEYVPSMGWSDVHVLKINAEGYDFAILNGGRELLQAGKIHLIFTPTFPAWVTPLSAATRQPLYLRVRACGPMDCM
jgi:hypothetical protein